MYDLLFSCHLMLAFYGLAGVVIGSFLNVVIVRFPLMLQRGYEQDCKQFLGIAVDTQPLPAFNLAFPWSHCPKCKSRLRFWHNLPLLSFILLRGHCAFCHEKISWRYPLVEFFAGLIAVISGSVWTAEPALFFALILGWGLLLLAAIDMDCMLLPDQITQPLLWLGLLVNTQTLYVSLDDAVYGAALGYALLWCCDAIYYKLKGVHGMGSGDFKLLAALGAWLGVYFIGIIILLASLTGAVAGLLAVVLRKHQYASPMPFGPFLAIAGWCCFIWGDRIQPLWQALLERMS